MAKISLISRHHRKKRFPDTEAQRRARAREQHTDGDQSCRRAEVLDVLTAAPPLDLLEFDEDHLMEAMGASALLDSSKLHDAIEKMFNAPSKTAVSLELTAEQSRALLALPAFSEPSEENGPPTLFQLSKSQDHRGITLQFSLHTQAIPEMISLKEVCRHLKVGRRTVMRLIRRRQLRCYRIAHRYRFAVEDVKHYLDCIATY